MKSKIITEKNRNKVCDDSIVLSIGLIVKNEEKVLRRCLSSLLPLTNVIPSEIIIVDTGSNDCTVDIAKEYTDKVFSYKWTNDFSAARNETLKKAHGKWYMYLDADEYIGNIEKLTDFFIKTEPNCEFNSICICIRNFINNSYTEYRDSYQVRLHRLEDNEIIFTGRIHETIVYQNPVYDLDLIVYHTGYIFNNPDLIEQKKKRNGDLLIEEYNANKNELEKIRLITLIINNYINELSLIKKYIDEGLLLLSNNINSFSLVFISQCVKYYYEFDKIKALEICEKYKKMLPDYQNYEISIEIVEKEFEIFCDMGEDNKALKSFKNYMDIIMNDSLIRNDTGHILSGLTDNEIYRNLIIALNIYFKNMMSEDAFEIIEKIEYKKISSFNMLSVLKVLYNFSIKINNFDEIAKVYSLIMNNCDNSIIDDVIEVLGDFYTLLNDSQQISFAYAFSKSGDYLFNELMSLVCNQKELGKCTYRITDFARKIKKWNMGYIEILYLAMIYETDIFNYIDCIDVQNYNLCFETLVRNKNSEYKIRCLNFIDINSESNIKKIYWYICMCYQILRFPKDIPEYLLNSGYDTFCNLLWLYISNVYNYELLNDDDIKILPEMFRLGYYIHKAEELFENNNISGYLKYLKLAFQNSEELTGLLNYKCNKIKFI